MFHRLRESLVLLLIGLLPFNALLVTAGTKLIAGPGNAPLTVLALWKEVLLAVILIIAFAEWISDRDEGGSRWRFDDIDLLIFGLVVLSVIISAINHVPPKEYAFGFKYDFVPLIAFFTLRRVSWSEKFLKNVSAVLILAGVIVAVYGMFTLFLPERFFYALGYSDLHSLYLPDKPLAAFQYLESGGWRRMQSVMSGPNQLGIWLLIPLSVSLIWVSRRNVARCSLLVARCGTPWRVLTGVIGLAILLTFSRSAWIGAAAIMVAVFKSANKIKFASFHVFTFAGLLLIAGVLIKPDALVRLSSSRGHLVRPLEAVMAIWEHPFGQGLGSAGPASNRVSDTCVRLRPQDDPSWANDRSDLCVFLGSTQVQPVDRVCKCPNLPENWYLQIGVELGAVGFVMFITLVCFVLRKLKMSQNSPVFLAFLGVSIAALFLHAWEDSAVAYTVWMLVAGMGVKKRVEGE